MFFSTQGIQRLRIGENTSRGSSERVAFRIHPAPIKSFIDLIHFLFLNATPTSRLPVTYRDVLISMRCISAIAEHDAMPHTTFYVTTTSGSFGIHTRLPRDCFAIFRALYSGRKPTGVISNSSPFRGIPMIHNIMQIRFILTRIRPQGVS